MYKIRVAMSALTMSLMGVGIAYCQTTTVKDAFLSAPFSVLPSLPRDAKLDMIDFFEHGVDRGSISYFGDETNITALDSIGIKVRTSPQSEFALYLSPEQNDTLLVVIETVEIPAKDSRVAVYDKNWNLKFKTDSGVIADWLKPDAKKSGATADIENAVSFVTAVADFSPENKVVIFTNTIPDRLSSEEYSPVSQYIKPARKLLITTKGFKPLD